MLQRYRRLKSVGWILQGLCVTGATAQRKHGSSSSAPQLSKPGALTLCLQQDGVRNIILNNPQKRNTLSLHMLQCLQHDLLHDLENQSLRVIIISAKGSVFSSGHDLKELAAAECKEHQTRIFSTCAEVMTSIPRIPVPVIAMVNGLATAAGCQLVASCDMAVASETSKFATPGVNVGLFCSTPAVALGRSVPRKVALEMLFTGEPISAKDALLHGLLSKVVPEDKLEEETMNIAKKICSTSRSVVALGKTIFYRQMTQGVVSAYETASEAMVDNLSLRDGKEGIEAFFNKREPIWSHKME
ncbi:hypothetical protein NDU88_005063 [Pleurodeles waltl]|uniref:Enoyl-CoA hydratase domain-containing protein 3, mitochondrial n=1 Tax=Pleurodeles waltl TaxID=8319 RepID=A0AAV7SKP7_PLEWA|nr:hypothetical protein NDU88_005063 [Pleurodeles waltl]